MNEIITWIFVDSFLFTIEIILAFLFSLKLKVENSYKIAFFGLLLFIISSYNILVIPIHYYHIVIPRTAVYNIKLVSLLLLIIISLPLAKDTKLFFDFLKRRIFVFYIIALIVGSISLILSIANNPTKLDSYFFILKKIAIVYLIVISTFIFYQILRNDKMFLWKFAQLISIIMFLNFVSLQFIDKKFIWIKWGLPVKALDQSDQRLMLGLIFLILSGCLPIKKFLKSLLLFSFIVYGSAFKLSIERTFSVLIISFLYKISRNIYFYLWTLVTYLLTLPLAVVIIGSTANEGSIKTRFYQVMNFLYYLKDNYIFTIIGWGFNKAYKTYIPYPYDPGAWSLQEKNSIYKIALQVPVVSDVRDIGVIAIILKIFIITFLIKELLKDTTTWRLFICTYLSIITITQIIPWSPKIAIYIGFFLSLLLLNPKYIPCREERYGR